LVFQSGFTCNSGVIPVLVGDGDAILSDELNHASIIDGIRMTRAERKIWPHADMDALETALQETQHLRRRLIITDGVFSMDGDVAKLPEIVELSERYGAIVYVDDAHASGVFGRNGRGTVDHFNLQGRVHVQVGTLSKALGVVGGYVASTRALRDLLIQRSRTFLFTTSHPPGVAAACIAAIDVLLQEPERIEHLWDNTRYFKSGLQNLGLNTGASESPITPVIAGTGVKAIRLSDRLFEEGIFAQGIGYPVVPDAKSRVRTIVTATHTREDLDKALRAFARAGQELGLTSAVAAN
ncbi:MAG: aminotransferase class I/II-fold pyridoxal phosphate-dependent enzyme, partial [Chloroflexota bacterium]